MSTFLLTLLALIAAALCGWFYWQIQQSEARMKQREEQVRAQAVLVGELADEISMASQYLYEAMDRCLAQVESIPPTTVAQSKPAVLQERENLPRRAPAKSQREPDPLPGVEERDWWNEEAIQIRPVEPTYHPHFQALEMATQGIDTTDIARHTGLGVEELRLLLRFQEELSVTK